MVPRVPSLMVEQNVQNTCENTTSAPALTSGSVCGLRGQGSLARLLCPRNKSMEQENPDHYPVYPEDDGYDRPRNPYSPV
jgi:hypothetical protein